MANWLKIMTLGLQVGKIAVGLSSAGLVLYGVHRFVDDMTKLPHEEAVNRYMAQAVTLPPEMFDMVQRLMQVRARQNANAAELVQVGSVVKREQQYVNQLATQYSVSDSIEIIMSRVKHLSPLELMAFMHALQHGAQQNVKLQTVVNGVRARIEHGGNHS